MWIPFVEDDFDSAVLEATRARWQRMAAAPTVIDNAAAPEENVSALMT